MPGWLRADWSIYALLAQRLATSLSRRLPPNSQLSISSLVDTGQFGVALTDDYLQEALATYNQAALALQRPWLLVKPVGTINWIGPVFRPGKTGCWQCLAHRLRGNRDI